MPLLLLACCSRVQTRSELPNSACSQQFFDGSQFTVCNPGNGDLKMFAAGPKEQPVRRFADLETRISTGRVAFAMNAGMFDTGGHPIGLAIVDGRQVHAINLRRGGGNFHLLPNGVFLLRKGGRAEVVRSDEFKPSANIRLATQSGPMLVIEGKLHPKIEADGPSRNVRNGVGVTSIGKALFVISDEPVSFGKFARFFRDGLHTPNALFLDGAVSSLWDPANARQDAGVPLGPIIVAFKPAASTPDHEAPARPAAPAPSRKHRGPGSPAPPARLP
jgi:uncharacterized protein YigE (DUF2233 family)